MKSVRGVLVMVGLAGAVMTAAGCFGDSTPGDNGEVEFSLFAESPPDSCFFGCRADLPVAVSASTDLFIHDERPDQSFTIRAPGSVDVEYGESFTCEAEDGSTDSRDVAADEPCRETEVRKAQRSLVITPNEAGEQLIEVLLDGEVLDSISIDVRAVASMQVYDEARGETVESLTLSRGETRSIAAVLLDADGEPLYCSRIDAAWTSDDDEVALVDDDNSLFAFPTAAEVTAEGPGTTTVRLVGASEIGSFELTVN